MTRAGTDACDRRSNSSAAAARTSTNAHARGDAWCASQREWRVSPTRTRSQPTCATGGCERSRGALASAAHVLRGDMPVGGLDGDTSRRHVRGVSQRAWRTTSRCARQRGSRPARRVACWRTRRDTCLPTTRGARASASGASRRHGRGVSQVRDWWRTTSPCARQRGSRSARRYACWRTRP